MEGMICKEYSKCHEWVQIIIIFAVSRWAPLAKALSHACACSDGYKGRNNLLNKIDALRTSSLLGGYCCFKCFDWCSYELKSKLKFPIV